jgi:ArsR family transcriptional regulator
MKILTESAIVACRKDGKWSHYKLSTKGVEQTKKLLSQLTTENDNAQESCTCSKDNILAATSYIQ